MLSRLMAAMASEDVSFAELAELIEKDTVIAAYVLRIVNSAAYGHAGTIGSIRHALTMLGLVKLRNTVLGLSMSRMWLSVRTARGWNMRAFNEHSVATAVLADLLATNAATSYAEGAFAAGLLHDIGKLLIAVSLPEEFAEISQPCGDTLDYTAREREILGFDHAELAASALARWNLPLEVQDAVRDHHQPDDSSSRRGELPLCLIVHYADRLAHLLARDGFAANSGEAGPETAEIFDHLAIPDGGARILAEFEREYSTLRAGISGPNPAARVVQPGNSAT